MFFSREGRDLGVAFQDPPGCQASSRGEAKDSAVLPSRDADLLEPPSGVNGVKPPLHFGERARDCSPGHVGKEGPSPREDGGSQLYQTLISIYIILVLYFQCDNYNILVIADSGFEVSFVSSDCFSLFSMLCNFFLITGMMYGVKGTTINRPLFMCW